MELERFNKALLIKKQLDDLNYQLGVLKEVQFTSIRFGTNFNVFAPISISEDLFNKIKSDAIQDLEDQIQPLSIKFDHI